MNIKPIEERMADIGAQLAVIKTAGLTNEDYVINLNLKTVTINSEAALRRLDGVRNKKNADVILSIYEGMAQPLDGPLGPFWRAGESADAVAAPIYLHLDHRKARLLHGALGRFITMTEKGLQRLDAEPDRRDRSH